MPHLTRKADYGIRLMMEIGARADGAVATAEAAQRQQIPYEFLRKAAQTLVCYGLLASERGGRGGLTLARPAETITVLDIVRAFELPALNRCTLEPPDCDRRDSCAAYAVWVEAQSQLDRVLSGTRLSTLIQRQAALDERSAAREAALSRKES